MTKDADVRLFPIQKGSPVFCELPACIHNMTDGDAEAGQLDHGLWWKSTLFEPIDIARDGRHRSNDLKLLDNGSFANITGVKNVIDALEVSHDRRIEQAMGIGNDSDANRA